MRSAQTGRTISSGRKYVKPTVTQGELPTVSFELYRNDINLLFFVLWAKVMLLDLESDAVLVRIQVLDHLRDLS
jgi:hypothetical protein